MKDRSIANFDLLPEGMSQPRSQAVASSRTASLDLTRFIMALMVVGAHSRAFVDISYSLYFYTYVGGWARIIMPLFLMISGFFFVVQVRRGVGRWAWRLLVLHLIWSTIYIGAWMPLDNFSLKKAVFWYFFGAGHLWFMPALLGGGLMLYTVRHWSSARLLLAAGGLYGIGGALQYGMNVTIDFATVAHHNALYAVPRNFLFYGFPFVTLGYVLARDRVLARVQEMLKPGIVVLVLVLLFAENWLKFHWMPHDGVLEINLMNFVLAPIIFAWLMTLHGVSAAAWMAPVSAAIYFVHALVLLLLEPVLGLSPTPLTLVTIVLSFAIGMVLVKVNNKPLPLV